MASDEEAIVVVDNPGLHRYEARLGAQLVAVSEYVDRPGRRVFTHTEVDGAFGGRGVSTHLASAALDDVRARSLVVTPRCAFIAHFMRQHPEYDDILEPGFDLERPAST